VADDTIGGCSIKNMFSTVHDGSPVTYDWTPGTGLSDSTILQPVLTGGLLPYGLTTYSLEVTDKYSCTATTTVDIFVDGMRVDSIRALDIMSNARDSIGSCEDVTLTVYNTGSDSTYAWSPSTGMSDSTIKNPNVFGMLLNDGVHSYTLTMTDTYGCTTINTIDVVLDSLAISSIADDTIGTCESLPLTSSVEDGTPQSYQWSPSVGLDDETLLSPEIQPTVLIDGGHTYTLVVTDVYGCTASLTVDITIDSISVSTLADDSIGYCNIKVLNSVLEDGSAQSYAWGPSTGLDDSSALSPLLDGRMLTDGDHYYGLTVTDIYGCTDTANVLITLDSLSVTTISDTTIGQCEVITLSSSVPDGSPVSYSWNPPFGLSSSTTLSPQVDANIMTSGEYPYVLTVHDRYGCSVDTGLTVWVDEIREETPVMVEPTCYGYGNGSIEIGAYDRYDTTPVSYSWDNMMSGDSLGGLYAGTYEVTISDVYGCSIIRSYTLTEPDSLTVDTTIIPVTCHGGSDGEITLIANGGTTPYYYNWEEGYSSDYVSGLTQGTYDITVTDAQGCTWIDSLRVGQPTPLRIVDVEVTPAYCDMTYDGAIRVYVEGSKPPYEYVWSNSVYTSDNLDIMSGDYDLTIRHNVMQKDGCEYDTTITVGVIWDKCIRIPSAFSPNGDGVNEDWKIKKLDELYPEVEVEVYDRWGQLVFSSKGYDDSQAWDGTHNGYPLPVDSYHYIIDLNDGSKPFLGQVTILR